MGTLSFPRCAAILTKKYKARLFEDASRVLSGLTQTSHQHTNMLCFCCSRKYACSRFPLLFFHTDFGSSQALCCALNAAVDASSGTAKSSVKAEPLSQGLRTLAVTCRAVDVSPFALVPPPPLDWKCRNSFARARQCSTRTYLTASCVQCDAVGNSTFTLFIPRPPPVLLTYFPLSRYAVPRVCFPFPTRHVERPTTKTVTVTVTVTTTASDQKQLARGSCLASWQPAHSR